MPDFSKVTDQAMSDVLPVGTYAAEVVEVTEKDGPKGLYYNWKFRITDPEYHGKTVFHITSFSEATIARSFATLQVIAGETLPRGQYELDDHIDDLIGRPVRLKLAPRVDDSGVTRNDVKAVLPPTSGGTGGGGSPFGDMAATNPSSGRKSKPRAAFLGE